MKNTHRITWKYNNKELGHTVTCFFESAEVVVIEKAALLTQKDVFDITIERVLFESGNNRLHVDNFFNTEDVI